MTGKLTGLIFPDYRIVDKMPERFEMKVHGYGLDFGFSADPTALIECALAHGELWTDQIIYNRGMTNPMIASAAKDAGITRKDLIIADSAEPKSIAELRQHGVTCIAAQKGKDSVNFGIQWLQHVNIIVDSSLTELINELTVYKWQEDKDGNTLPKPVDRDNHLLDGLRYSLEIEMGWVGSRNIGGNIPLAGAM